MYRAIEKAVCSCGGNVKEVEQTPEEQRRFNCSRGCCGTALVCDKCGTRFVLRLESPEME